MSGSALKRLLSRAQMRLADRSDACEGPGWARTEHMQQESGYVGGVPKMAAGADAFLEDAGCWQASLTMSQCRSAAVIARICGGVHGHWAAHLHRSAGAWPVAPNDAAFSFDALVIHFVSPPD